MRHVDDGTLNAWLDGALPPGDAAAVAVHLEHCEPCRSRLGEAEHWRHAADKLLAAAEPGDLATPPFQHVLERASAYPGPALRPLAPYHPGQPLRALPAWATVAWAATILLALAVGYYAGEVYRPARQTRDESGRLQTNATRGQATPAAAASAGAEAPAAAPPSALAAADVPASQSRRPAAPEVGALPASERLARAQESAARGAGAELTGAAAGHSAAAAGAPANAPPTVSPATSVESPRAPKAFANNLVAPSSALDAAGKVWTPAIAASPVAQAAAEAVQQRATRPSDVSMKRADSAAGAQGASPAIALNIEAAPTFTPYTVRPELLNREEVRLALVRFYPPLQKGAGVEGTTLLWALVDTAGMVKQTRVRTSSGVPSLDQAAQQVAAVMRFSPALNHDAPVPVWIQLPVVFKATP